MLAVAITASSRAAAVQRGLPAPGLSPEAVAIASARHRSSVVTLRPTARDTAYLGTLRSQQTCYHSVLTGLSISGNVLAPPKPSILSGRQLL